jgi:hypothetical protein
MAKILLILNQKKVSSDISTILKLENHEVIEIDNETLFKTTIVRENPEIVLVDTFNGDALTKEIRKAFPEIAIICWMQERNARTAVDLMVSGATDCLCQPIRAAEVLGVINHALGRPAGIKKGTKFMLPYLALIKYKKYLKAAGALLFLFIAVKIGLSLIRAKEADIPVANPTSIISRGKNAWIGDWYTQSIYKFDLSKRMALVGNYYFSSFGPVALAMTDKHLWSVGNDLKLRQHMLNDRLEVVRTYNIKEHSPTGIEIIGDYVWIVDANRKKIYKYLLGNKLSFNAEFECHAQEPVGLGWDGRYLWVGDAKTRKLFAYVVTDIKIALREAYKLPEEPKGKLSGIYPKGGYIYAIYTGNPSKFFRHKIKKLQRMNPDIN